MTDLIPESPRRIYLAHPYGGDKRNLQLARDWVSVLGRIFTVAPIATWITLCETRTEEYRQVGMEINRALIEVCEILVACGGWSPGVRLEAQWARICIDLTGYGPAASLGAQQICDIGRALSPHGIKYRGVVDFSCPLLS